MTWTRNRRNGFSSLRTGLLGWLFAWSIVADELSDSTDVAVQVGNPRYQGKNPCPAYCFDAGAAPSNWSVYHNLEQLQRCTQSLFLSFTVDDHVDDPAILHRVRACTVWGEDWLILPGATPSPVPATEVNTTFQLKWQNSSSGGQAQPQARVGDLYSLEVSENPTVVADIQL